MGIYKILCKSCTIFLKQIQLINQVKAPGYYNYFEGMKLSKLLDLGKFF